MWAPPDLLLHTTAGILNFLIFLSNATRSKGYKSISNAPNLHLFSSLIGIDPTPLNPFM